MNMPIREILWNTAPLYGQSESVHELNCRAIMTSLLNRRTLIPCPNGCGSRLYLLHTFDRTPEAVMLDFDSPEGARSNIEVTNTVTITVGGQPVNFRLGATFCYSDSHYSVICYPTTKERLFYDGVYRDGALQRITENECSRICSNGTVCACIYLPA